jgi:histidinol dehydrogenase
MRVLDIRGGNADALIDLLEERARLISGDCLGRVKDIVESVKSEGDNALLRFTLEFDGIRLDPEQLKVDGQEIDKAYDAVDSSFISAIKKARDNIWDFHSRQVEQSWFVREQGTILGQMISPIDSIGVYVPGGSAAYPSSVLMNVIPAKVAGVGRIVMITPPGRAGIRPEVLVAASAAGVDEVYRVGGAQGIAALAYGTETINRVDKIVGPGNIYVAIAKKLVFGDVGIDMIAGPSEILIIADDGADPVHVAADMISQAEHDMMASSILITMSESLISAVNVEIEKQLGLLRRKDIARKSLDSYGALVLVNSLEEACSLVNRVAPEHLELMVAEPMELIGSIKNSGAVFMGYYSPEPLGDYMAGPNHVLPTGRTARFSSPLSVEQFIKKSSLIYYSKDALSRVKDDIITLAAVEGLEGHGRAVKVRFEQR